MKKEWKFIRRWRLFLSGIICSLLFLITGCGPKLSSRQEIQEFEKVGSVQFNSAGTADKLADSSGPYQVIPGDILEFQMPAELRIVTSDLSEWNKPVFGLSEIEPYLSRVDDSGAVTLPIIGKVFVWGMTLAEIEATVKNAYYPKYVVTPPQLVCSVKNYQNEHKRVFAVLGLVQKPGSFPYPPDIQYSLLEAIAFAGGLNMVADPRYVKIYRADEKETITSVTLSVDSKSLSDTVKVRIKPGDVIYVDHTFRTRTNQFLADVFHITVGAGADLYDD